MSSYNKLTDSSREGLRILHRSLQFIKEHFLILTTLGMIAAVGRVFQLGGFGPISPLFNAVLEVIIQFSRIVLFLYVLGLANIESAISQIKIFVKNKEVRKKQYSNLVSNFKNQWLAILIGFSGYGLLAFAMNYMIDLTAYQTCFLLHLKENGILHSTSSEWTMLLFLKNLSVIPFTLVFETLLILWLTSSLTAKKA